MLNCVGVGVSLEKINLRVRRREARSAAPWEAAMETGPAPELLAPLSSMVACISTYPDSVVWTSQQVVITE